MSTKMMTKLDEKTYHVVCPVCGEESVLTANHMICPGKDCGYPMRPDDMLTMSLFEKARLISAIPLRILSAPVSVLPVNQMGVHIIDLAKWQYYWDGQQYIAPNYVKMKNESDMIYVIHKASQGIWDDPTWGIGVDALLQLEVAIGSYHFADVVRGAVESAEHYAAQVNEIPDINQWGTWEFPQHWLDAETNKGSGTNVLTPFQMATWIDTFLTRFKELCPQPIGIYSREIWWNDYVARNDWAHNYAFWCARYNPYISESGEPLDWSIYGEKSLLWQYSADGNGKGSDYGVYSNSIDLNRCQSYTRDQVFDIAYPVTDPGDDCCDETWEAVNALNVRVENLAGIIDGFSLALTGINADITELRYLIENHTHDEDPPGYLTVIVENDDKKNCSVYRITDYDKACENYPDPEYKGPKGKPIPETKIGSIGYGRTFLIFASGYESCIDDRSTPEVLTSYGDYYRVYGGEFDRALIPAKRVRIIETE